MYASYTSILPLDYNPAEADFLRAKYRASKLADTCPAHTIQTIVSAAAVALDMDLTQEAPVVLAEVTSQPIMYAQRGEVSTCQSA